MNLFKFLHLNVTIIVVLTTVSTANASVLQILSGSSSQFSECFSYFEEVDAESHKPDVIVKPLSLVNSPIRARREIVALAQILYQNGQSRGEAGIFPIDPSWLATLAVWDQQTRVSFVAENNTGHIVGFAIVKIVERGVLELEKLGVDEAYQDQKIGKSLLYALALRANEIGYTHVRLLVLKANDKAIAIYQKYGFQNITPKQFMDDPRFNAYSFAASVPVLLERTSDAAPI